MPLFWASFWILAVGRLSSAAPDLKETPGLSSGDEAFNYECAAGTDCHDWCKTNVSVKVVDETSGEVEFSTSRPPHCCNFINYQITLCQGGRIHSNFELHDNLTDREKLTFTSKYVASGRYKIDIRPFLSTTYTGSVCKVKNITVRTEYKLNYLFNKTVRVHAKYFKESKEVRFYAVFDFPKYSKQTPLEDTVVTMRTVSESGVSDCYKKGSLEVVAEGSMVKSQPNDQVCSLSSHHEGAPSLTCLFSRIEPNLYCFEIDVIDLRCEGGTLWTLDGERCRWHAFYNFTVSNSSFHLELPFYSPIKGHLILWLCAGVLLVCFLLFLALRSTLKSHRVCHPLGPWKDLDGHLLYPQGPKKLLLLYPRDCDPFMRVMVEFRDYLKNILNVEIYDVWDPGVWDDVAKVGEVWSLNWILNHDIQIVVVASECSLAIEERLLGGKRIKYRQHGEFDNHYPMSFKTILQSFLNEQYKRVIVIRLNEPNFTSLVFKQLNPFTVYTIPQNLNTLVLALHDMDSRDIILDTEKIFTKTKLEDAIKELSNFKTLNPHYLSDLLEL